MNLSRHYTRISSRICSTYNNNNNDNNTLTYNNKLYTIILCSLHAMCQNILQQYTRRTDCHYIHICESGILFVFWLFVYANPFSSLMHSTTHLRHQRRTSLKTKKTSLWFYEIFRTRLPAYFPVLILIQWCECAFYASFPNGSPHLTGSNFLTNISYPMSYGSGSNENRNINYCL